uniref:Sushi domain-containing protein n=1 Tax=Meleagris gallopavo TaxID=9103 RepID=A0A803YMY1_MELGA
SRAAGLLAASPQNLGPGGERSPRWGNTARSAADRLPTPAGDCPEPPRFVFAEPPGLTNASYPVGEVLKYRCRPGYTRDVSKSNYVTCLPNSTWASDPDFCIGECLRVGGGSPEPPRFHTAGRDTPQDRC